MTVSVQGITFYRPSVSVSTQYFKDNDNNNVGQKDTITITDTVLSSDNSGLLDVFNSGLSKSLEGSQINISYPGNTGTYGVIKSVSATNDSDYVNKLIYTVVVEAVPTRSLYSIYHSGVISSLVSSLTETESWDIPYDMSKVYIFTNIGSGIYYNKPITYTYNLQISCGSNSLKGITKKANANHVFSKLARTTPSSGLISNISGYTSGVVTSINRNSSADGSYSLGVTTLYLPSDASGNLLVNQEISEYRNVIDNYTDRSYNISINAMPGSLLYSTGTGTSDPPYFTITGIASGLSTDAFDLAYDIMEYFIDTSGFQEVSGALPGGNPTGYCNIPYSVLVNTGCFNTKSLSLEKNLSNNSATLNIQQTNQNLGNCDLNGYKIDYNIVKHPKNKNKIYSEAQGWSSTGYWIQDMNTFKDTYYEYSIDVTSIKKCTPASGTGIIDKAKEVFSGIDILSGSGIITSYIINSSEDKCSLKIVQYSGLDQSTSGIGYQPPA